MGRPKKATSAPAVPAAEHHVTEMDTLREILEHGDEAALSSLVAGALLRLTGGPVADAVVQQYLAAAREWFGRVDWAIRTKSLAD